MSTSIRFAHASMRNTGLGNFHTVDKPAPPYRNLHKKSGAPPTTLRGRATVRYAGAVTLSGNSGDDARKYQEKSDGVDPRVPLILPSSGKIPLKG